MSMKNAAKPRGVFPRTSVEKYCLNASPAMVSMGLEAEAGETRMLVASPGTLVAANIFCRHLKLMSWSRCLDR